MQITYFIALPEEGSDGVREVREVEVFAPDAEAAERTVFAKYPDAVITGYRLREIPEPDEDEDEDEDEDGENENGN